MFQNSAKHRRSAKASLPRYITEQANLMFLKTHKQIFILYIAEVAVLSLHLYRWRM